MFSVDSAIMLLNIICLVVLFINVCFDLLRQMYVTNRFTEASRGAVVQAYDCKCERLWVCVACGCPLDEKFRHSTQRLQYSAEGGGGTFLILGSLILPCYVLHTASS